MAGVANTTRLSARLVSRLAAGAPAARRGFRAPAHNAAAHNFSMPALSPTMTEGNISAWRVKEGDSFSAGDVLLEIETDKATMDVEAQDDGILVKVMQQEGSKGIKVGQRIAVTADPEDDVSSLEIPAEDASTKSSKSEEKESSQKQQAQQKSDAEAQKETSKSTSTEKSSNTNAQATQGGKAQKQTYPLYPSVEALLHQNGLSSKDADSIPATGPSGRLLKGDVLAYLGRINKEYPEQVSQRINKLSHLDLSNIQVAKPSPKAETAPKTARVEAELPKDTEVAVPISLSNVIAVQKRVKDTLGIFLPLSTFIARASELANQDLPHSKTRKPTSDELFNAVLGLDNVPALSHGNFVPLISGISPAPVSSRAQPARNVDLIDLLASSPKRKSPKPVSATAIGVSADHNVFSVIAPAGDEARATRYLERMKIALEEEPGQLVL